MNRLYIVLILTFFLGACGEKKAAVDNNPKNTEEVEEAPTALSSAQKSKALQELMLEGSEYSLSLLTIKNGLNKNAVYRIPLPKGISQRISELSNLGIKKEPELLQNALNEAGERTLDSCSKLLGKMLESVQFENPDELINSGQGAITFYVERQITKNLKTRLLPVVQFYLDTLGATKNYQNILNTWNAQRKPGDGGINTNLVEHTLERTLIAYFGYIKIKENNIRQQPESSKSALVARVMNEVKK